MALVLPLSFRDGVLMNDKHMTKMLFIFLPQQTLGIQVKIPCCPGECSFPGRRWECKLADAWWGHMQETSGGAVAQTTSRSHDSAFYTSLCTIHSLPQAELCCGGPRSLPHQPPAHPPASRPPSCGFSLAPQQRAGPLERGTPGGRCSFFRGTGSPSVLGQLELWGPRTLHSGLAGSRTQ